MLIFMFPEFRRDLEKDVVSDTSGHLKRLLVSMCQVISLFPNPLPHLVSHLLLLLLLLLPLLFLLIFLLFPPQGAREENTQVDLVKAKREAQELYRAGEGKWGTDESKFNQVLAVRSFPQLRATFDEYVKVSVCVCVCVCVCVAVCVCVCVCVCVST